MIVKMKMKIYSARMAVVRKTRLTLYQPRIQSLTSPHLPPPPSPSTLLCREMSDPENNRFDGFEYRTSG